MTPVLGSVSLSLAAGFGILSIILLSLYIRSDDYRFFLAGRRMAIIVSVLVIIATLVLVKELITSNFDVDYCLLNRMEKFHNVHVLPYL